MDTPGSTDPAPSFPATGPGTGAGTSTPTPTPPPQPPADPAAAEAALMAAVAAYEAAWPAAPSPFARGCLYRLASAAWLTVAGALPAAGPVLALVHQLLQDRGVAAFVAEAAARQEATQTLLHAAPDLEGDDLLAQVAQEPFDAKAPVTDAQVQARLDAMVARAAFYEAFLRWSREVLTEALDHLVWRPLCGRGAAAVHPDGWALESAYRALGGPFPWAALDVAHRLLPYPAALARLVDQHPTPAARVRALRDIMAGEVSWPPAPEAEAEAGTLAQARARPEDGPGGRRQHYHPYAGLRVTDDVRGALGALTRLGGELWQGGVVDPAVWTGVPKAIVYLGRGACLADLVHRLTPGARGLFTPGQWRLMRRDLGVGELVKALNDLPLALQEGFAGDLLWKVQTSRFAGSIHIGEHRLGVYHPEAADLAPPAREAALRTLNNTMAAVSHVMARYLPWGEAA